MGVADFLGKSTIFGAAPWAANKLFPDPSKGAQKYLDQVPGVMKPYYDPWINAGREALPKLQGEYGEMMSDPGAIIARLAAGYKESPGYQYKLGQGEQAITNAQASGGMLGTPQHQQEAGQLAENLSSEDFDKYLQEVLGLFGGGLQGTAGLSDTGFKGSSDLATNLATALMNQAGLSYAGQASRNKNTGDLLGGFLGAAKNFFGGGGAG